MENKYLSDGRKVAVVGKLNNQETIVQEIFVTSDGGEVPSGENFVVKSLHDKPVVSYKEAKAKQLELRIKELEAERDVALSNHKKRQERLKAISEIVRSSEKMAELLPESELEVFSMFMTGSIKYLWVDEYTMKPPVEMIDRVIDWEGRHGEKRFDSVKLISVLGRSEGRLEYRIHRHYDGSGGSTKVYPFTNLEDALSHIKNVAEARIDDNKLNMESYKNCIEMGIVFSDEHTEKYKKVQRGNVEKQIQVETDRLLKTQKKIAELQARVEG